MVTVIFLIKNILSKPQLTELGSKRYFISVKDAGGGGGGKRGSRG